MGRILGIDYGAVRFGIALSDPTRTIASPLEVIKAAKSPSETIDLILKVASSYEVDEIVVGLPLLLSGKESATTKDVRSFAALLKEKSGLPIILQDERLTSKEVERILIDSRMKRKKRSQHIDRLSATLILQTYLNILSLDLKN